MSSRVQLSNPHAARHLVGPFLHDAPFCYPSFCPYSYKWDTLPSAQRPERGLLAIRAGLNAFANLRPAIVPRQVRRHRGLGVRLCAWRGGGEEYS